MTFEEKRKALGIRSDEELAADLERLLTQKEQIEKEQIETQVLREALEAEIHISKLFQNILDIAKR